MHCGSCRHDNPAGARFCAACGVSLAPACPDCGSAVAEDLGAQARAVGIRFVAVGSKLLLAELALRDGQPQAAREQFRAAAAHFKVLGPENAVAQARFGEGRALVALRASAAARAPLADALAGFEPLGTLEVPAQVRGILATLR